jgi:tRNA threonylcarbamoyladenosine biosynthesis protein TsaE
MLYFRYMKKQIASEQAMKDFAHQTGAFLKGGEFIELVGDVGAGKTTFTKGLASGLGIKDTIQSPTFTINRTYEAPSGIRLVHYDFYRLDEAGIMATELVEVSEDTAAVAVVEWADAVASVMPSDRLTIKFETLSDTERSLELITGGDTSTALLEKIT